MSGFERNLTVAFDFISQGIDNYEFDKVEEIPIVISALRGVKKCQLALDLYAKYEKELAASEAHIVALKTIIKVCKDCGKIQELKDFTEQLKAISEDNLH